MGRVRKSKSRNNAVDVVESKRASPKVNVIDALNIGMKSYLKLALKEMATMNKGVISTFDDVCNNLADNAVDSWLDVFFEQYKLSIGMTDANTEKEKTEGE